MSIPGFTAVVTLQDPRRHYCSLGNSLPTGAAGVIPSQSCLTFCGPANSAITMMLPVTATPDSQLVPVTPGAPRFAVFETWESS
jgi:hypothetical protein